MLPPGVKARLTAAIDTPARRATSVELARSGFLRGMAVVGFRDDRVGDEQMP